MNNKSLLYIQCAKKVMRIKYTVIKPDFLRHIQLVKETGSITGLTMLLDNVIMFCFDFLYVFSNFIFNIS